MACPRPAFIQELIHQLVSRRFSQIGADDLVECLTQMGRTTLGGGIAFGNVLSGLIHRRVDACEAHDGAAAWKTADIANLIAPLAVALSKSGLADQIDTLAVPRCYDEIHPFWAAVSTIRAGEQLVHAWKDFAGERNEIILQCHSILHVESILAGNTASVVLDLLP